MANTYEIFLGIPMNHSNRPKDSDNWCGRRLQLLLRVYTSCRVYEHRHGSEQGRPVASPCCNQT